MPSPSCTYTPITRTHREADAYGPTRQSPAACQWATLDPPLASRLKPHGSPIPAANTPNPGRGETRPLARRHGQAGFVPPHNIHCTGRRLSHPLPAHARPTPTHQEHSREPAAQR
jgi:hypothetical protein